MVGGGRTEHRLRQRCSPTTRPPTPGPPRPPTPGHYGTAHGRPRSDGQLYADRRQRPAPPPTAWRLRPGHRHLGQLAANPHARGPCCDTPACDAPAARSAPARARRWRGRRPPTTGRGLATSPTDPTRSRPARRSGSPTRPTGSCWPRRSPVVEVGHWELPGSGPVVAPVGVRGRLAGARARRPAPYTRCRRRDRRHGLRRRRASDSRDCDASRLLGLRPGHEHLGHQGAAAAAPTGYGRRWRHRRQALRRGRPAPLRASPTCCTVYDPAANTWTDQGPDARRADTAGGDPPARSAASSTSCGSAPSGIDGPRELYFYDPATDSWSAKAPVAAQPPRVLDLPLGGKLYADSEAGATANARRLACELRPGHQLLGLRRADRPPAPRPNVLAPAAAGLIAVRSTRRRRGRQERHGVYDPATDTWARPLKARPGRRVPTSGPRSCGHRQICRSAGRNKLRPTHRGWPCPSPPPPPPPADPVWVVDSKVGQLWP